MATKRSAKERRRSRRRAAMVLVPTVAGVFIAGTAFAYWSTTGNGTGSATTDTTTAVTVTQTSTLSLLAPGSPAQPIDFKITNSKLSKQYIASVTIAVSAIKKTSDNTTAVGCLIGDFVITQPSAINTDLPNGDTAFPSTATGASIQMSDTAINQDACKSTTLTLSYTAA